MSDGKMAIRADEVSKKFRLAHNRSEYLKEAIKRAERTEFTDFWALKNVSFEVEEGSMFGIIGHNGSGKSTLLRLLSNIYRPTTGKISTKGRISALLELGTGFHPQLSGRENIYLNASILGISAEGHRPPHRRHHRLRRHRRVHRLAGEDLLQRHEGAARLLGRGARRAGDPPPRRGGRRGRRALQAPLLRAHLRAAPPGRDHRARDPQPRPGPVPLRPGHLDGAGRGPRAGPRHRHRPQLPPAGEHQRGRGRLRR